MAETIVLQNSLDDGYRYPALLKKFNSMYI